MFSNEKESAPYKVVFDNRNLPRADRIVPKEQKQDLDTMSSIKKEQKMSKEHDLEMINPTKEEQNKKKSALYRAVFDEKNWEKAKELITLKKASYEDIKEVLLAKVQSESSITPGEEEKVYILMLESTRKLDELSEQEGHKGIYGLIFELMGQFKNARWINRDHLISRYDALESWFRVMSKAKRDDIVISKRYSNEYTYKFNTILEQFCVKQKGGHFRITFREQETPKEQDLDTINSIKETAKNIMLCKGPSERIAYLEDLMWSMPLNNKGKFKFGKMYDDARLLIADGMQEVGVRDSGGKEKSKPTIEDSEDNICPISQEKMKNPIKIIALCEGGFASIQKYDLPSFCSLLKISTEDFDKPDVLRKACKGVLDPRTRGTIIAPRRVIEKELDEPGTGLTGAKPNSIEHQGKGASR